MIEHPYYKMNTFQCQFFFLLIYQGLSIFSNIRGVTSIIKIEEIFKKLSSVFINLNQKIQSKKDRNCSPCLLLFQNTKIRYFKGVF